MKEKFVTLLRVLEELTYFVPHVVFALLIVSLFIDFGQYDFLFTILLLITYIALVYGERYFTKARLEKEMNDRILEHIKKIEGQVTDAEIVRLSGLMKFADIMDEEMERKVNALRDELRVPVGMRCSKHDVSYIKKCPTCAFEEQVGTVSK